MEPISKIKGIAILDDKGKSLILRIYNDTLKDTLSKKPDYFLKLHAETKRQTKPNIKFCSETNCQIIYRRIDSVGVYLFATKDENHLLLVGFIDTLVTSFKENMTDYDVLCTESIDDSFVAVVAILDSLLAQSKGFGVITSSKPIDVSILTADVETQSSSSPFNALKMIGKAFFG
ncbi:hypothetical protein ADUPG1_013497 [Aduncisulcus paluster]|uniref:AP complex mu/sigma subunit domain-containing protein n=1 Tax=Aduncisulcus paluster TaxID=2918883 RepID=A0ABQ5K6Q4_9EUKA|nr:hypothetical protein ADUPG1_013497 [Aduncisulcus paluster]